MDQIQPSSPPNVSSDVDLLESRLEDLPSPVARSALVLVCGLPGSGKSHFSRELIKRVPLAFIQSDVARRILFPTPSYSRSESARLFRVCHALIRRLLERGMPVLFDATNLVEQHREFLYNISYQLDVKLIIVFLTAPTEVVQERLSQRQPETEDAGGSEADWQVYKKMAATVDPLRRSHYVVDTSMDVSPVLEKVAREVRRAMRPTT